MTEKQKKKQKHDKKVVKNTKIPKTKSQKVFHPQDSDCFCFVYLFFSFLFSVFFFFSFFFLLFSIYLFVLIFIFPFFFDRFFFLFLYFLKQFSFFSCSCFVPSLGSGACHLSSVRRCCLVSSFPWSGVAVFPSPVWWGCLPSPPLGGAALFTVSFCVVLLGFLLPFGWCCCFSFSCSVVLPSFSSLGCVCVLHLLCWVVLLGFLLPFGWCCCFSFSCWVVLLGLLPPWCCVPSLLLRGAAWFLPSLGGLSCLVVLPSIPSID